MPFLVQISPIHTHETAKIAQNRQLAILAFVKFFKILTLKNMANLGNKYKNSMTMAGYSNMTNDLEYHH